MNKQTKPTKEKEIKRDWHLVDAKGKVLGRVATEIAQRLIGKNKPYYVPSQDCGDNVVVINAKRVEVTGDKEIKKKYTNYSGYPGGLRVRRYTDVMEKSPEEIMRYAVSGMLPKNKLRKNRLKRMYVFNDENHSFTDKFENK